MAEPHRTDDDVITELVKDHRELEEMFREFEGLVQDGGARKATLERKAELARDVITELVRHSVAEEQWVYPAARRAVPDGPEIVEGELAEHSEVERLLKRLEGLGPDDEAFDRTMDAVILDVRDHVAEEEAELFPRLKAAVSGRELRDLGDRVRLAKAAAPTRPHPSAPDRPPLNTVLDPMAGLVDRLRDAFSRR